MAVLFESVFFNVIVVLGILISALCLYVTRNFNFWKNRGVQYVKPLPFFGSLKDVVLQRVTIGNFMRKVYYKYKGEPYVGIFSHDQPSVVLLDLDLVKNVMVKDAPLFFDHTIGMEEDLDPLASRILFASKGDRWKHMRKNLSPTFSSGRMKAAFSQVDKSAKELIDLLDAESDKGTPIDVTDPMSRFTIDVLASFGFGIDSNSVTNPHAEFTIQLRKRFEFSTIRIFAAVVAFFAPKLLKILRLNVFDQTLNSFMRETVWNTVEHREKNGVIRKDFLHNMMEMRRKGMESSPTDKTPAIKVDGDHFVAQALSFLTAGYETSSSTMCYALYEMSLHPEIQRKARKEVIDVLAKHNHEITYEGVQELKYLDMVVAETLRKYPILPFLDRKCATEYKIPAPSGKGTVTVPAGTGFYIPLMAIQHDPEYFPEPLRFDPERFTEENKLKRPNYSYMPFGEGPRFCIGMRFGLVQTKTGLARILINYEVEPCKETQVPVVFEKKSYLLTPESGIPLTFKRIRPHQNTK